MDPGRDGVQLLGKKCIYTLPKINKGLSFEGTCKYEVGRLYDLIHIQNTTAKNNRTIAIIGNSWAANQSPLVYEECRSYFGNIHRASGSCKEILAR